jgi:hypothetical protein
MFGGIAALLHRAIVKYEMFRIIPLTIEIPTDRERATRQFAGNGREPQKSPGQCRGLSLLDDNAD